MTKDKTNSKFAWQQWWLQDIWRLVPMTDGPGEVRQLLLNLPLHCAFCNGKWPPTNVISLNSTYLLALTASGSLTSGSNGWWIRRRDSEWMVTLWKDLACYRFQSGRRNILKIGKWTTNAMMKEAHMKSNFSFILQCWWLRKFQLMRWVTIDKIGAGAMVGERI